MSLENIVIAKTVDARGSACPGPILEAKKGISKVKKDEVLAVLGTDVVTKTDLPIWATRAGHEFLGIIEEEGYFRLLIRRKK